MRPKSAAIASLILLALSLAVPVAAEEKSDTGKMVTCKDGTTSKDGNGACAHHGGVQKGGASASAHEKNADKKASDTAKCKDGTESHSKEHNGACSEHGGGEKNHKG